MIPAVWWKQQAFVSKRACGLDWTGRLSLLLSSSFEKSTNSRAKVATVMKHILTRLICAFPNLRFLCCWWWQTPFCCSCFPSWRRPPEYLLWKNYPRLPSLSLCNLVPTRPFKKVLLLHRVWTVFQSFLSTWHHFACSVSAHREAAVWWWFATFLKPGDLFKGPLSQGIW